ncbi:hypothetical protein BC834DRAFT_975868 [Gloeopeniophorella convolvens]|nr:hypothetical protein BC834DRAFT_975868 [Gloeopeniophorella convolvens]
MAYCVFARCRSGWRLGSDVGDKHTQDPRFTNPDRSVSPPFRLREPHSPLQVSPVLAPAELNVGPGDVQLKSVASSMDRFTKLLASPRVPDTETTPPPAGRNNLITATPARLNQVIHAAHSRRAPPQEVAYTPVCEGKAPMKKRVLSASAGQPSAVKARKSPVKRPVSLEPTGRPSTVEAPRKRPLDELWADLAEERKRLAESRKRVRELEEMIIAQIGVPGIKIVPTGMRGDPIVLG